MKTIETEDGSNTLYSERFQQTYHSVHGASTETRHVFLQASGTARRLRNGIATSVLEIGFGLGLNFLLTADMAKSCRVPLWYTAFEFDLISADQFDQLTYSSQLQHPQLCTVARNCISSTASVHRERLDQIQLELFRQDVSSARLPPDHFDVLYLDAFSPASNPECWTEAAFQNYYLTLKPGGVLSTYSAQGTARRRMLAAGFTVEKQPGPPGKREMLIAAKPPI